jgi:hypothetical protein
MEDVRRSPMMMRYEMQAPKLTRMMNTFTTTASQCPYRASAMSS